jgi:hypothetical protein
LRSTDPTKDQILNIFLAVQGRDLLEVVVDENGQCCKHQLKFYYVESQNSDKKNTHISTV